MVAGEFDKGRAFDCLPGCYRVAGQGAKRTWDYQNVNLYMKNAKVYT
jgi:hypothetical protein